jgi:23S rRNA pseudouridine1911/1915/1917 synthase
LYGKPLSQKRMVDKIHKDKIASARLFKRQALHATKLSFIHPITKQYLEFVSPLPNDIKHLIEVLKN